MAGRDENKKKKEERRGTGKAGDRAERYRSRGEFGKVDGRYYGASVKNERDIKKKSPSVSFVHPRDRGRRVSHLIKARKKKRKVPSLSFIVLP